MAHSGEASSEGHPGPGFDPLPHIEKFIGAITIGSAWILLPLLIGLRCFDIVARQFMNTPGTLFQFLEWRAFLFLVMLSFGYAYLRNSHVRIDLILNNLSHRKQVWIEIIGFFLAILPFCLVIIWYGGEYVLQSYHQGEREVAALGLPVQWVVKAMLPFGAFLLFLAGSAVCYRNVVFLLRPSRRGQLNSE